MTDRLPEQQSRELIDSQLEEKGWQEIEEANGTGYIEEYPTSSGPVDYILVVNGEILGLVEAKKSDYNSSAAFAQAERYSEDIETSYSFGHKNQYHVPFVFTANGEKVEMKDLREYASSTKRELRGFHTPQALEKMLKKDLEGAFAWLEANPVEDTHDFLWNNQKGAIAGDNDHKGIEQGLREGKRKLLVQMATGTGKTWMAAAEIHRLLDSGLVNRVLFIADRTNLAKQAERAFNNFDAGGSLDLGEIYEVDRVKNGEYPDKADIVVSTLQSMYSLLENHDEVDIPQDAFDLVITDEVHRSIYGEWKVVLSHFDSYQIGLTATPAEHTLSFFGSRSNWIYKYRYWEAVDDGKVVPYEAYRIQTGITMEGLEYEGEEYKPSQLEREITVPDRNRLIAEEVRNQVEDGEKILVFAINDEHAIQLTEMFNEVYSDKPNDYVRKITYTTDNAEDVLSNFKNEYMEPTIAVTVEMVSTGTDVPPLENIVFARPVKSPILYNQMMGRGTRTCESIDKEKFTIFDCVGVIEYFQDQKHPPFDQYRTVDSKEEDEKSTVETESDDDDDLVVADDVTDELIETESGYRFQTKDGEELRPEDYISAFEQYIEDNSDRIDAIKILQNRPEDLRREHLEELNEKLRAESETFTEERLQKAYSEEMVDLLGFVKHAIGEAEFPTTEERVEKAFEVWEQEHEFTEDERKWLDMIREHFKREKMIKEEDFNDIPFIRKGGWDSAAEAFGGEEQLKETLEELNKQVILA
ncbi:type I restriction-modification enzyme R subunit C-terminal domain-containing protein [Haloarcula argentinensis]|uniref:DEAD/DEAH box helicase n=1 Tax=Haloarcula argentinensis TaxID=43776 RepID=A0A847U4L8_HALAR|nr:type I restriction-modification enzyme R subunit C-terminal domain-containing protein [Haloarcula argentinensis]NLV13232.1 DEAD/DEAH box helicase [Haloarcula argentinensis]